MTRGGQSHQTRQNDRGGGGGYKISWRVGGGMSLNDVLHVIVSINQHYIYKAHNDSYERWHTYERIYFGLNCSWDGIPIHANQLTSVHTPVALTYVRMRICSQTQMEASLVEVQCRNVVYSLHCTNCVQTN